MVNSESLKLQKVSLYFEEYAMTCYFRPLQEIFKKAGIEVTKENRQGLDKGARANSSCRRLGEEEH